MYPGLFKGGSKQCYECSIKVFFLIFITALLEYLDLIRFYFNPYSNDDVHFSLLTPYSVPGYSVCIRAA